MTDVVKNNKPVVRNEGIDLLRIISMFMVVLLHVLGVGGLLKAANDAPIGYEALRVLQIGATCAVNCYGLISGYVGYKGKFKLSSIALMWLQVFVISVGLGIVCYFAFPSAVSLKDLVKLCLPVLTERYWYFTAYFALCFTRPLLNAAINSIPKREFEISFGILIFLLTVGQTTVLYSNPFGTNIGYSYLWLCVLYCLGGYLAKYKPTIRKKFLLVLIYLTCVALCWCSQFVLGKLGIVAPERLEAYNSPLVLLMAVALLLLFSQLSVSKLLGKLIAFFAPISFGVYLIHLHPLIRNNILLDLFTGCAQFPAWSLPIIAIFSAALIFLICALLDWCRLKIFSLLRIKQVLSNLESRLLSKTEDK